MRILVLAGGESAENEVSCRSGLAISEALTCAGFSVGLLDPARKTVEEELFFCDFEKVKQRFFKQLKNPLCFPMYEGHLQLFKKADKIFPALHGGIGENGRLAAMLDIFGVSYAGSSAEALAVSMNKVDTKIYYDNAAIPTPCYTVYRKGAKKTPIPPRYPCVVKPATAGSSIGVEFVSKPSELPIAVEKALRESDTVLMESRIIGREFSVCVLEDKAFAVTEIIPKSTYYDYESKYLHGGAREITPAPLSRALYTKALSIAQRAHEALGLKNFSRTDLILKKGTESFYALETNALPGLTETSILPNAAASVGINFSELACRMLR